MNRAQGEQYEGNASCVSRRTIIEKKTLLVKKK